MAIEVQLPRHGLNMTEGVFGEWYKKEGDYVEEGENIFSVETDKAVVEVEAPASGILKDLTAQPGDVISVGQKVAILEEKEQEEEIAEEEKGTKEKKVNQDTILATPIAKKIASEEGIDLKKVPLDSGEKIYKKDILFYLEKEGRMEKEESTKITGKKFEMSRAKKITGERMTHSFSQTPHFYLDTEVKLTELKEFKAKMTDATGFKFSYNDFIIAAVARSLKRYPLVNGSFVEGEIRVNEDINVALATATERGLLVPVIKEANKISLLELGKYRKKLVKKTREERITVEELEGGTFTISNLGMFGIKGFYPIINPPQAGILAVGKIEERVVAEKGKIGIEPMMDIRLAADHRVLDGVEGAKFLMSVKELLEDPDQLTG